MENIETKEEKLKKLFLQYLNKIKGSLSQQVEYRVHGGNQINELMNKFRTEKETTIASLIDQFLEKEFKEKLTEIEITKLKSFAEKELEQYLYNIEQDAYAQLRKYVDNRYVDTVGKEKKIVADSIQGNDIYLLGSDRPKFERNIKADFLQAEGPMRSNKYGLEEKNLPQIEVVIKEAVDKLVKLKG